MNAERRIEEKKQKIYTDCVAIKAIEDEIKSVAFKSAKNIIANVGADSISTKLTEDMKKQIENLKKEKEKRLRELGVKEDAFLNEYECKLCKDTGYIQDNYETKMCSCLKQKIFDIEYNQSNISKVSSENFDTFDYSVYSDEVNKEKYGFSISPRKNIEEIRAVAENFIENFDNPNEKNLCFIGNTGLGKTFLTNCIADKVLKMGKTVLYQTAPIMFDNIINYKFGKSDSNSDVCKELYNVDLLIIDDLGTETINRMTAMELFNILNTRILNLNNKTTKTIISTNLNLKSLSANYDERIISRIIGYYDVQTFIGDDIRLKKR
jgi:DNA replication protein DnaC